MKIWLYGRPLSGKTTFASQFENAYIISTDGNAEYTFQPDKIFRVKNYEDLNSAIAKLKSIKPEWLIVDTTSYLIDYLKNKWYKDNGVEHESMIAYRGYTMLRTFMWQQILSLANDFDNIIFISHELETIEKGKFGKETTKFGPVFEEKLMDQMAGLMGIIARVVKITNEDGTSKYELHIGSSETEFGGCRLSCESTVIQLSKEAFDKNFGFDKIKEAVKSVKSVLTETSTRKSVIG